MHFNYLFRSLIVQEIPTQGYPILKGEGTFMYNEGLDEYDFPTMSLNKGDLMNIEFILRENNCLGDYNSLEKVFITKKGRPLFYQKKVDIIGGDENQSYVEGNSALKELVGVKNREIITIYFNPFYIEIPFV